MIADRDTDVSQGHREEIGARDVTGPILTLEGPGAPLSLPRQLDQSLGFANECKFSLNQNLIEKKIKSMRKSRDLLYD